MNLSGQQWAVKGVTFTSCGIGAIADCKCSLQGIFGLILTLQVTTACSWISVYVTSYQVVFCG